MDAHIINFSLITGKIKYDYFSELLKLIKLYLKIVQNLSFAEISKVNEFMIFFGCIEQ